MWECLCSIQIYMCTQLQKSFSHLNYNCTNLSLVFLYPDLQFWYVHRVNTRQNVDHADCIKGTQRSVEKSCPRRKKTLCSLARKRPAGALLGNKAICPSAGIQMDMLRPHEYAYCDRDQSTFRPYAWLFMENNIVLKNTLYWQVIILQWLSAICNVFFLGLVCVCVCATIPRQCLTQISFIQIRRERGAGEKEVGAGEIQSFVRIRDIFWYIPPQTK